MYKNIDEAIKHAREVAVDNRNNLKYAPFTQEECIKCAEEHEQLAEWLEELKELRYCKDKWNENQYEQGNQNVINKINNLKKRYCNTCTKTERCDVCTISYFIKNLEIIKDLEMLKEIRNEKQSTRT